MPKLIKCLRPISAIKILDEIINFDAPENRGKKVALVSDDMAKELLKREGFELLDKIPEEVKEKIKDKAKEEVKKAVKEQVWPQVQNYFKKLLGGKK